MLVFFMPQDATFFLDAAFFLFIFKLIFPPPINFIHSNLLTPFFRGHFTEPVQKFDLHFISRKALKKAWTFQTQTLIL